MNLIKTIQNHFRKPVVKTRSTKSGRFVRDEDKRAKVREGTKWAMDQYGKTFETLRDYDRS